MGTHLHQSIRRFAIGSALRAGGAHLVLLVVLGTVASGCGARMSNDRVRISKKDLPKVFETVIPEGPLLSMGGQFVTIDEDQSFTGVLDVFNPSGKALSFQVVADGFRGVTSLDPQTGIYTYQPYADQNGADQIIVQVSDGVEAASASIDVMINPVNDMPMLSSVSILTGAAENSSFAIDYATLLTSSDAWDPDGDLLQFRIESVSSGTLTREGEPVEAGATLLAEGQSLIWTPAPGENGDLPAFTVRAYDGELSSASEVPVMVQVSAVSQAPTLGSIGTIPGATEDTAFSLSYEMLVAAADEADADGDSLSFRIENLLSGSVTKNGVAVSPGTTLIGSGESVIWMPAPNANGDLAAFTVRVYDGSLTSELPVQVVIATSAVNDTPTLTTISPLLGAIEDSPFTISYEDLLAASNASDVDGDAIRFRIESVSTGTLSQGGAAVVPGTTLLASGESLVWTPAPGANGSLNAFTVRAFDGSLASAQARQVVVNVGAVNDAPTLSSITTLTGANEDTPFSISYAMLATAANESDPEGDAISFRIEAVSSGTLTKGGVAISAGSTLLSSGESLVWTPALNANGNLNAFTVRAFDGSSASASAVQVVVATNPVNDAPTLSSVAPLAGASEDTPFAISYSDLAAAADEADVDGNTLSFRIEAVSTGTLTQGGVPVVEGSTLLSSGGSLVWTPAPGVSGNLNAFTVRAYDGAAASVSPVQVVVSTGAVNDPPTLTTISTLSGATEDTLFSIPYAALAAAANEADPEGDSISFRIEGISSGTLIKAGVPVAPGTTLLSAGESLSWTPAANANGNLSAFTVRAYDGQSASATAVQVVVSTAAVADAPTLSLINTLSGATENASFPISYSMLASAANEADVDGDAISFRVEAVSTGTLTQGGVAVVAGSTLLSSGGTLVWTPAADANGNLNAFTVRAYDGGLASSTAVQVIVNVGGVNSAPTLTSVSVLAGATEDTAYSVAYAALAAAANEADADGDALSFRIESVSSGNLTQGGVAVTAGSTLLSSGGSLVWTPALNANGNLSAFTIRAYDGALASASPVQVVISVSPVNDAPTLSSIGTLSGASEDVPFTISYATILAASNAADVEGSPLSFRVEAISSGTLTKGGAAVTAGTTLLSSGESLVWTPAPDASGNLNAFTVRAYDGALASSTAVQVVVSTAAVNDAPTLSSISTLAGAIEDTPFTISYATLASAANESDPEGAAISFRVEGVTSGSLTKNGTPVVSGATLLSAGESLIWVPALNANGVLDAFTVRAYDGAQVSSSAVLVKVNTAAVNDAPTLSGISTLAGALEDSPFTITYASLVGASNAADVEGDAISFRVEAVSSGTLSQGGVAVSPGSTLLSTGGSLVWTPASGASGSLNAFTVRAYDGAAASASPVQVVVSTGAVNDAPTLSSISTLTGATEDTAFTVTYAMLAAAANEMDPDGDAISFRVEAVSTGTLTKSGVAVTAGSTLLSSGESLIWTPALNANGGLNAFTVRAYDGAIASASAVQVAIAVSPVNDAPTLSTIAALTGATEDSPFTVTYALLAAAANEADVDGDALSFRVEAVSTGTLTQGGMAVVPGSTLLALGGSLVWTPALNATGNLNAFTVRAYDGAAASGAAIQVVIDVNSANDAPTLTTISTLTGATEDTAYTISYAALASAANEADADGDAISFRVEAVSSGTLTKGGTSVTGGTTVLASGESLVWTPALNANGSLNAFTVRAYDGSAVSSSPVQVVVSVSPVNDAPTLTLINTLSGAIENSPFTISYAMLAGVADEADVDSAAISFRVEAVSSGMLTKGGIAVAAGSTLLAAGESLVWTPALNANGNLNAFTVRAYDGAAASSSPVQVVVSTGAVNDAPTLSSISTLTGGAEDTLYSVSYTALAAAANEADSDGDAISFRIEAISTGTLLKGGVAVVPGTTLLSAGESLSWMPDAHANGNLNAFTVRAYDGQSASSSAVQVVVATAAVADAPTLSLINTLSGASENSPFTISYATLAAAANEADPDGTTPSFRIEAVSSGTLIKNGVAVTPGSTLLGAGESVVWTPALDANGNLNAFTVRAYDGALASASPVQVVVNVGGVNSAPTLTLVNTLTGATEDMAFSISYATLAAAANEADPDGDALSFRVESVTSGNLTKGGVAVTAGTTLLSAGESWVWMPGNQANGNLNAFTIRAYDGALASASAIQVVVNVSPVNDAPTLSTISTLAGAQEDTAFTIAYSTLIGASNANDADGNPISFRIEAVSTGSLTKGGLAVTAGTTTLASGESLVWTPAPNANGNLNAFTVRAYDGAAASASAVQVVVATAAVNDAPTLSSITTLAGAMESTPFAISYAMLATAANEADVDGDAVYFRVEAVSSGTLSKGGVAVVPGSTLIGAGESLLWTPVAGANGNLNAFTLRASDGTLVSASPIQVVVSTGAVNDAPTLTTIATLTGATEDAPFAISYAMLAGAANEADADGDAIAFRIEAVSAGTLTKGGVAITAGATLLANGESLVWTPAANANGSGLNAFTVRAHDGTVASASAIQVKVDVAAVNDAPTLSSIGLLGGATEDTPFTISYAMLAGAANEADVDGTVPEFRIESVASGTLTKNGTAVVAGSTVLASGESLVWTPAAGANGNLNAFSVRAYDGIAASSTAVQVQVNVDPVNDAPTLSAISTLTGAIENAPFTISYATLAAAANEVDPDGDAISFRIESLSTGTLTKNGSAITAGSTLLASGESLVWTPANGASGNLNAFVVRAYDGALASAGAVQVVVSTGAVNDAPTLTTISTLTGATEDSAFAISYATLAAAANEADPDGDALSFRIEALSTGTLTKNGVAVTAGSTLLGSGESLVWTPAANANGTINAFSVRAYDGSLSSASPVQVIVSVTGTNDAPTLSTISTLSGATEDTAFAISYATLAAAANEADIDGDALSFRIEAVSSGTLTKNGVAVVAGTTLLASGESVSWTPAAGASGNLNAFTVRAYDGSAASASAVQVVVSTGAVNDAPTLSSISTLSGASEDTVFSVTYAALAAAANEADADGDAISFRIEAVSSGTLLKAGIPVTAGSTLLSSGESLAWTPAPNANGNLSAFTVRAYDGQSASATAVQVVVATAAVADAPTLSLINTLSGATENAAFAISYATLAVAANEADVDGDALSFRIEAVSTGTLTKNGVAVTAGSTLLAAGESLVWTPALDANGNLNAFTVRAYDGALTSASPVQVVVNVGGVNSAPTLSSVSTLTGATEDTAFTISYATLAAAANEADPDGDALSFRVESVTSGNLTKGGVAVTAGATLLASGESWVWTPGNEANGNLNAFTIRAYDGALASTSAIQVVVSVSSVNDAPTLSTISTLAGASEDTPFTISHAALLAASNANDVDGNPISFRIEALSTGTLTKNGLAVTAGSTTLASGESLVWTPVANANGNLNAFTVRAYDGTAASASAVQVVVATAAVNDAPSLNTIATLTGASEDTPFTISYATLAGAADEADVDGTIPSFRVESVSSGTLTRNGIAVTPGSTVLGSAESLVWTPASGASGTLSAFTVRAYDGALASATAIQVQVTVGSVNDAPTLTTIGTLTGGVEDSPFSVTYAALAAAANEADPDGDALSFRVEAVSTGTLTKNGVAVAAGSTLLSSGETVVWTPASGANGNLNAFTVRAYDGALASSTAVQVVVATSAVNDAPTLSSISALTGATEDAAFTISYTALATAANESDPDGDAVSFRIEAVSGGTLTKGGVAVTAGSTLLSSGESLVWTPSVNSSGNLNAFTVRAYDGALTSASAVQVVVAVTGINDAPTLSTISTLTGASEDAAFSISYATLAAAANEADVDGDAISFRIESVTSGTLTKNGVAVIPGSTLLGNLDSVVWTPAAGVSGNLNAFTLRAYDGALASATAVQVVVSTSAVNDAPTLSSISTLTGASEDTAYSITHAALAAAADEADADGDAISFQIEAVSTGTLTKNGTSIVAGSTLLAAGETVVWTPAANASGNLNAFTVRAYDGTAVSASAVQVVVATGAVNDAPSLSSIAVISGAVEDAPFTLSYASLAAAANEADPDGDALSFRIEALSTGTLTKNGVAVTAGSTLISSGESVVWTPVSNANGNLNAFTVRAYDGALASATAVQVVVATANANDAPTLSSISILTGATQNTPFTISYATLAAAANEADIDGTTPSFRVEAVSTGTLTKNGVAVVAGSTTIATGESVVWTPAAGASGNLNAFTVRAYDGSLASSTAVQVVVNAVAANSAPTLTTISALMGATEDTAFTISYTALAAAANEADPDGDAISFLISSVTTGTLTKNGTAVIAGATLISSGESVVWTPAANANGSLNAFRVRAYDGSLQSASDVQVVVSTAAVNDVPTLSTLSTLTGASEDSAFTISYTTLAGAANEADADGTVPMFRVEAVSSGTLTKNGVAVAAGVTTLASGESLVWTPAANVFGALAAFSVRAYDGVAASATAVTVNVSVSAVNDGPGITSIPDKTVTQGVAAGPLAFMVSDVDTDVNVLALSGVSSNTTLVPNVNITFGGVGSNRTVTVTPAAGQTGTATITVTVSDGVLTASSSFVVTVVPAVNLEVPIELLGNGASSDSSVAITFERSRTYIDTNDYDGSTVRYYFEVVAYHTTGGSPAVSLVNASGTTVSSVTLNSTGTSYVRYRSAAFTPTAGQNSYRLRIPAAASGSISVRSARVIIQQTGATKTRLYFPLLSMRSNTNNDGPDGGDVDSTSSTSYSQTWIEAHSIFRKDMASLATIAPVNPWRLEVFLRTASNNGTAYAALYNRTTGLMVGGTEFSTSSDVGYSGFLAFSNGAANFADLNDYEMRLRSSTSSYPAYLYKANLSVKLENLTRGRVYYRVASGHNFTSAASTVESFNRSLIDLSKFSQPTAYFETCGWVSTSGAGTMQLTTNGVSDSGNSGTAITGTTLTPSTTKGRRKSAAIAVTSGDRLTAKNNWSTGTLGNCGSYVVIDFSN